MVEGVLLGRSYAQTSVIWRHKNQATNAKVRQYMRHGLILTGMAMSLSLFYHPPDSGFLMLGAGFESGHVCLFGKDTRSADHSISPWQFLYTHKAHSQPGTSYQCW